MKVWKQLGGVLITLLALTAMLTGTALAAESEAEISVQLNGEFIVFDEIGRASCRERVWHSV